MSIIHWPFDKWMENVALAALSSKQTLQATYDLARAAIRSGVPGDFVECGVFGGAQCAVMARALMLSAQNGEPITRRVHLFDSFAGVPAPGEHDIEWKASEHPEGVSICTLEGVKQHMVEWGIPDELLVYHRGLFAEPIPVAWVDKMSIDKIALLRLDGDLYESTKVCTERLYPLVSPGGWVIVDDFSLSGARKAYLESINGESGPAYFCKQPL